MALNNIGEITLGAIYNTYNGGVLHAKGNEATRQQNETGRVTAEGLRATAETGRANAEIIRQMDMP